MSRLWSEGANTFGTLSLGCTSRHIHFLEEAFLAVPSFQDLPLADRDRERDGAAAEKRVRTWAGAEDQSNQKYREAHVCYDAEEKTTSPRTDCSSPTYRRQVQTVPRGVLAAEQHHVRCRY